MTENHEYGPSLEALDVEPEHEEDGPHKDTKRVRDGGEERANFFQKMRQDTPYDDRELARHVDLEAEHGHTYDHD